MPSEIQHEIDLVKEEEEEKQRRASRVHRKPSKRMSGAFVCYDAELTDDALLAEFNRLSLHIEEEALKQSISAIVAPPSAPVADEPPRRFGFDSELESSWLFPLSLSSPKRRVQSAPPGRYS